MDSNELKLYLKSLPLKNDKDRPKRIKKAKDDFYYFVKEYFSHYIGIKQGEKHNETSIFRKFIYKNIKQLTQSKNRLLFSAYRGSAKTTLLSRLFPLWCLAKASKRYIVLISSNQDISKEILEAIKLECEDNANFVSDFDIALGDLWSSDEIVVRSNNLAIKIKASGSGKKLRGLNFLSNRPDLIICDDIENDEQVESKNQRDKLYSWLNKAVFMLPSRINNNCTCKSDTKNKQKIGQSPIVAIEPSAEEFALGFAESKVCTCKSAYNIIVVGTKLHHDGLIARCANRDDFISHNFPLVTTFGANIDTLTKENLKTFDFSNYRFDDERIEPREVFSNFLENRASFYSEYQNEPLSIENAIFSNFTSYDNIQESINAYYIGIDPALGKAKGDYFAIATIAKTQEHLYLSAIGYKIAPEKMIKIIIDKYLELLKSGVPIKIAIETVAFQEFFAKNLSSEARKLGIYLPIIELKNKSSKELRIDSLSPLITNGIMKINSNSHLLIEELLTYPKAPHDDLLDASEMAFRIASNKNSNQKEINKFTKDFRVVRKYE